MFWISEAADSCWLGLAGAMVGDLVFLHIWDTEEERVERSFLPMGVPEESLAMARSFPYVSAALEADTIWAVWALSDTLYKFTRDGDLLGELPLPLPRPMATLPTMGSAADYASMIAAIDAITQVAGVFLLEGGDIVIQSGQSRGLSSFESDLLIVDRLGQAKLKMVGSPILRLVDGDAFYFNDPGSLVPNRLLVARRRVAP